MNGERELFPETKQYTDHKSKKKNAVLKSVAEDRFESEKVLVVKKSSKKKIRLHK